MSTGQGPWAAALLHPKEHRAYQLDTRLAIHRLGGGGLYFCLGLRDSGFEEEFLL